MHRHRWREADGCGHLWRCRCLRHELCLDLLEDRQHRLVLFEATKSFQGLLVCQCNPRPAGRGGLLDCKWVLGLHGVLQMLLVLLRELLKLRNGRRRPCRGRWHLVLVRRTLLLRELCMRVLLLHLLGHLALQLLLAMQL